jgi:hypothetical protein
MFTRGPETLDPAKPFIIDGIVYPGKWLLEATDDQLRDLGITRSADPPNCDSRFYWGLDQNNVCIPKKHGDLVTQWTQATHQKANDILRPTDWVIVRQLDNGIAPDENMTDWRQAIRDAAEEKMAKIAATYDTYQLQVYVTGGEYNTWPEKPA